MSLYDSPWKEALDGYFSSFMELCFPVIASQIDWTQPVRMLDKELQQIAPESDTGSRTVDKLVEVHLATGDVEWLLIHVEIQSQRVSQFSKRMFIYYYRILDKYDRPLVSLAVLGDPDPGWKPKQFESEILGCRMKFDFPIVKLLDYAEDIAVLEESTNPFATVVLAHLMAMQTVGNPVDRCDWKLRLLRTIYERGMSAEEVRRLFRVIDWMMDLPSDLEIVFDNRLQRLEEEYQMPYVTSIERLANERGREEGRVAGQIQLLQRLLGQEESTMEQLLVHPVEDLQSRLRELQSQLGKRK